jgi:cytochrome c
VTAVAVNVERGIAVTSGIDGIVRTWELASGMPTAVGPTPAPVTALALAADGATLAIGDATGTLTIVRLDSGGRGITAQAMGAVNALAFAPGGAQLAAADASGAVRLVRAADGAAIGAPRSLPQRVRSLDFDADGSALLVATVDWLHALRADASLEPIASRFAPRPLATSVLAAGDGLYLRSVEIGADGVAAATQFDLAAPPVAAASDGRHDWPAALGLTLDDRGQPAPFDP